MFSISPFKSKRLAWVGGSKVDPPNLASTPTDEDVSSVRRESTSVSETSEIVEQVIRHVVTANCIVDIHMSRQNSPTKNVLITQTALTREIFFAFCFDFIMTYIYVGQ